MPTDNVRAIETELKGLGYAARVFNSPKGAVVSFPYLVEVGSHQGDKFTLGVSMQGSELYPEYPPHWIHVSPPISDGQGGAIERYEDSEGRQWVVMSRPPGATWDRLRTKHMSAYLTDHLRRFWADI